MNRPQTRRSPAATGLQDRTANTSCPHDTSSAYLAHDWRKRLPEPAVYYAEHVARLDKANGTGWAHGACPFHDDHGQSLAVSITGGRGGWRCPHCGAGDLVGFHCRMYGLGFKASVRDLVGLGVRS